MTIIHRAFSRIIALLLGLFVAALLAELVGLVDYFAKTRRLYYFSPAAVEVFPDDLKWKHFVDGYRLHPFFGFTLQPNVTVRFEDAPTKQNNHGFYSEHDYPYPSRPEDELIVGIFGGSVAAKLAVFEDRSHVIADRLAERLGISRDSIEILSFAQGGFKQPQQFLVYSYFRSLGQNLDVVVNLDGFNEVALSSRNLTGGFGVAMPSIDHIGSLRLVVGGPGSHNDPLQTTDAGALNEVRSSYLKYARAHRRAWSARAWELRFAAGFLFDRKLAKLYRRSFHRKLAEIATIGSAESDSWLHLNRPDEDGRPLETAPLQRVAEIWAKSSALMHILQTGDRGVYIHLLQPNQYHLTGRRFASRERAIAFEGKSPYAAPVREGYPLLQKQRDQLRTLGVDFEDLTDLFDDVEARTYADNCCHYTETGQRVLAQAIATKILSRLRE